MASDADKRDRHGVAAQILRRFRGADGLPAVSLLGPRYAGKSQCLRDVHDRLRRRPRATNAQPVLLDLETLGDGRVEELTTWFAERVRSELAVSIPLAHLAAAPATDHFRLADYLRRLVTTTQRNMVILIDHLDAVPAEFARSLVRSFRIVFDQRGSFPDYKRIGVVFTGSVSLSVLRKAGESAFISEVVLFPPAQRTQQVASVRKYWSAGSTPENSLLPDSVALALAEATGGEHVFLELLAGVWSPSAIREASEAAEHKAAEHEAAEHANIDRAIRTICQQSDTHIFRELTLALFIDTELWDLVGELLIQGNRRVPRRDVTPDCDLFCLSGAVVLSGENGAPPAYSFRNSIVRAFVASLCEWRARHDLNSPSLAPKIVDIAEQIEDAWTLLSTAPDLRRAVEGLSRLWVLLGSGPRDEFHLCLTLRAQGLSYWLGPGGVIPSAGVPAATIEAVREMSEDDVDILCMGYDQFRVSLASALPGDRATLYLAVTLRRRDVRRLRDQVLNLWQRILERWAPMLQMAALAEIGHHLVALPAPVAQSSGGANSHATAGSAPPVPAAPARTPRLERSLLNTLAGRLAAVGHLGGLAPRNYFGNFLSRAAELPENWRLEVDKGLDVSYDDAAFYVVRWLEDKGSIPKPPYYRALAVVLAANASSFGKEDLSLFGEVIEALHHPNDEPLLEKVKALARGNADGELTSEPTSERNADD